MHLSVTSWALLAAAAPPALGQTPPSLNSSTTCNQQCQALARAAADYEASQHADSDSSFYAVPANFSRKLAPGSVLTVEVATDLTNYTVPSGLTMSRILYTTTDLNGTVQPASAYILWPAQSPTSDKDGFPLVAWAHGTSGANPACSPSNYKALQYHFMVPYALALQGIPVVAPDYTGLGVGSLPDGTPVPHEYAVAPAQANGLADAVRAARAAFPAYLSPRGRFVAAGHSQGGGIVWAFAERQVTNPVPGYQGTVAFAPLVDFVGQAAATLADLSKGVEHPWTNSTLSGQANTVIGVTAVYPSYNFSGVTDVVYDRLQNVIKPLRGCNPTAALALADVPVDQITRKGWTENPVVKEFQRRAKVGGKKVAGPMLVVGGEQDIAVPVAYLEPAFDATCEAQGGKGGSASLEYVLAEGQSHVPLIQASQVIWMAWVKEKLLGPGKGSSGGNYYGVRQARKAGCTKTTIPTFRGEFNQHSVITNWLVENVGPLEAWKYAL